MPETFAWMTDGFAQIRHPDGRGVQLARWQSMAHRWPAKATDITRIPFEFGAVQVTSARGLK